MKKNDIITAVASQLQYPDRATITVDNHKIQVKGALPSQVLTLRITKKRRNKISAKVQEVSVRAPYEVDSFCEHFGECGGCARQTVPYDKQLEIKQNAVDQLFKAHGLDINIEKTIASPSPFAYRNKMEYSFGDAEKGGQLNLGMHRKGRFYDVVSIPHCHIVDADYRAITSTVEALCRKRNWPKYNRNSGTGIMRNLVIRKGHFTGEILIGIATSSDKTFDETLFVDTLLNLELAGKIVGIYHLINDDVADVVKAMPNDHIIYGRDYFYEKLLGLTFKVSFHSFFQTNSRGAEVLYQTALEMVTDTKDKIVYDLFSGTGTIAQLVAKRAKHVYGVEIVEDAVKAAQENARANQIDNCTFIAGDVFKALDEMSEKPDTIIVDPPRAGMTPKTVEKLARYGVDEILYISCNPKTMAGNLVDFETLGYKVNRCVLVDLYAHTVHVECVALISRVGK